MVLAALALAIVLGPYAAPQEPQQGPPPPAGEQTPETGQERIRVDVNLTTLRFTVKDALGRYRNDLSREDLRLLENGIPQEIAFFERPRNHEGRTSRAWVAFLLDVSGSTFSTRAEEIVAAQTFLDNITDSTQTGIFGFTDKLILFQDFTSSRETALRAFREARRHLGRTAIYDSLNNLVADLGRRGQPGDQKAVIILSDGLDEGYRKAASSISLARQYGISIYTILIPSAAQIYIGPTVSSGDQDVNRPDPEREAKEGAFARLSSQTGGRHFSGFETILDFDDTLAQINDHLFGNLYTVGFYSDLADLPPDQRRIDLRNQRPGLTLSLPFKRFPEALAHKKGYIAALFQQAADGFMSGAAVEFREIGAQLDVLSGYRDGQEGVSFRIKINPLTFRDSDRVGVNTQLGVVGVLIDSTGREAVRLREVFRVNLGARDIRNGKAILYSNKLLAPPGQYELRLALLELATWRLTSFERSVRIPSS